jgi:SAM-dependent methyltransferase
MNTILPNPPRRSAWRAFFVQEAAGYHQQPFVQGTLGEVDFLLATFALPTGAAILDIGCGTGRHAIELARRGFAVTGVDQSVHMLALAREGAAQAGVSLELHEGSAAEVSLPARFQAAISLCEGALCLLDEDDCPWRRDMAVLGNVAGALVPGGQFLFTVLNAFRRITATAESFPPPTGVFDLVTQVEATPWVAADGTAYVLRERYYTPPELFRMVNRIGLKIDHVWCGTAGHWERRPPAVDDMELMIVGHKPT